MRISLFLPACAVRHFSRTDVPRTSRPLRGCADMDQQTLHCELRHHQLDAPAMTGVHLFSRASPGGLRHSGIRHPLPAELQIDESWAGVYRSAANTDVAPRALISG